MTDLVKRYEDLIAPVITWDSDLEVVESEGIWVTDPEGERYMDFACGIAVTNLGHRHPHVTAAVERQLGQVWHAGGVFRYDSLATAAERLREVTPDAIDTFFFMNSGAEAVEASVKLARKATGRPGVIVFRGAFHGRTMGSVSYTTSKAKYRQGFHPLLPSVFIAPFPHPFEWGMTTEAAIDRSLEDLDRMLRHDITPEEVACFLVEPVQGEGGYYPAGARFLRRLRELADEHGIVLIHDEVQTGFGRTGDWFAGTVYGIDPDVLVMGKALANGMPLSALGASRAILDLFPPGSHGTTFGGNPISCAAAAATIEALTPVIPGLPAMSEHAFARFRELQASHPTIGDVRGLGLMIGIELVDKQGNRSQAPWDHVKAHCLAEHLLLLNCGPDGNVIRFIPPLISTMEELNTAIDIVAAGIASWEAA